MLEQGFLYCFVQVEVFCWVWFCYCGEGGFIQFRDLLVVEFGYGVGFIIVSGKGVGIGVGIKVVWDLQVDCCLVLFCVYLGIDLVVGGGQQIYFYFVLGKVGLQ